MISRTIFLPMWGLQILLFGPEAEFVFGVWDGLVRRRSMECQLCEDNGFNKVIHIQ